MVRVPSSRSLEQPHNSSRLDPLDAMWAQNDPHLPLLLQQVRHNRQMNDQRELYNITRRMMDLPAVPEIQNGQQRQMRDTDNLRERNNEQRPDSLAIPEVQTEEPFQTMQRQLREMNDQLQNNSQQIMDIVINMDRITSRLQGSTEQVAKTVTAMDDMNKELQIINGELQRSTGQMAEIVADTDRTTDQLLRNNEQMAQLLSTTDRTKDRRQRNPAQRAERVTTTDPDLADLESSMRALRALRISLQSGITGLDTPAKEQEYSAPVKVIPCQCIEPVCEYAHRCDLCSKTACNAQSRA